MMRSTRFSRYASFAALLIVLILTGCAAAPTPTATPVPPTATPEPTEETAPVAAGDEILVVTGEFPPFTSESLEGGGFFTELVSATFAEMNRSLRIAYIPWDRAEAMVEGGEAWASFPYVRTPERAERFFFTDTMIVAREILFTYGDALAEVSIAELSDLLPYRIGTVAGTWYLTAFEEAGLTMDMANDELASLRKLRAGRVDFTPISYIAGQWLIQTNFAEDADAFGTMPLPIGEANDNALMVSRVYEGSEALLEEFNAAFAIIVENGTYQEILSRYGLDSDVLLGEENQ
jgi:polar amino acid transport system substrate-binding protein